MEIRGAPLRYADVLANANALVATCRPRKDSIAVDRQMLAATEKWYSSARKTSEKFPILRMRLMRPVVVKQTPKNNLSSDGLLGRKEICHPIRKGNRC